MATERSFKWHLVKKHAINTTLYSLQHNGVSWVKEWKGHGNDMVYELSGYVIFFSSEVSYIYKN